VRAEIGRSWHEAGAGPVHDVYHGPRGVLRGGAPLQSPGFDPGIAAFAASVTSSQNAPATYSNAAALAQQGFGRT